MYCINFGTVSTFALALFPTSTSCGSIFLKSITEMLYIFFSLYHFIHLFVIFQIKELSCHAIYFLYDLLMNCWSHQAYSKTLIWRSRQLSALIAQIMGGCKWYLNLSIYTSGHKSTFGSKNKDRQISGYSHKRMRIGPVREISKILILQEEKHFPKDNEDNQRAMYTGTVGKLRQDSPCRQSY